MRGAEEEPFTITRIRKPLYTAVFSTEILQSLFRQILNRNGGNRDGLSRNVGEYKDQPFTKEEVLVAIDSLKSKKAAGPCKIRNKHFRVTDEDLVNIWTLLYNKCLEHARIPNSWL
jgi:hypothetical protein